VLEEITVEVVFYAFHERWEFELNFDTSLSCCAVISFRRDRCVSFLTFCGSFFPTLPDLYRFVAFAVDVVLLTR
jgi:hypothetical protein